MREKILFNDTWRFFEGDFSYGKIRSQETMYRGAKTERMLYGPACKFYNDNPDVRRYDREQCSDNWEAVDLPHDYIIRQQPSADNNRALGYFDYKNAWYRKHFKLAPEDMNKRITVYFEGIATHSTIYINGCPVKRNFCGYTSFEADITDFVSFERENILAVYVSTEEHESWWYEGAGIYRNVWLVKTDKTSVDLWGVYVKPVKHGDGWTVNVENTIRNDNDTAVSAKIKTEIKDASGKTVLTLENGGEIKARTKQVFNFSGEIANPHLWNLDDPYQYSAFTTVETDDGQNDSYSTKFGFRTIRVHPDDGLFINEKKEIIKGVCCHQDFGLTGKAVPDNVFRHKVKTIKEMGANAFRCSHYPQNEATMDALDEMGFITMAETRWFDSSENGLAELEMLMKRDRNRPSIVFWSIGNEENDFKTERGVNICKTMIAKVRSLDDTRFITAAIDAWPVDKVTIFGLLDVIGINYRLPWQGYYEYVREHYPDKPIFASECCASRTTRGWYYDENPDKGYINAVDKDAKSWYAGREQTWRYLRERSYVLGEYQWIAFEHRGECVWPRLCSQSGAIDMFFQRKDAFYQNQSHWIEDRPMIHIAENWCKDGLEGELIPVSIYTNCSEMELFLNGKSLGRCFVQKYTRVEYTVPYEAGELKAVGYVDGKEAVADVRVTPGAAVALKLRLENTEQIKANGLDIALVTCYCVDEKGREVAIAEPFVKFTCNELGRIIGTGSDVSDHVPVPCNDRQMRAGRILVGVKAGKNAGKLKVYAESYGLKSAALTVELDDKY